jgi:hypothetical protein
MLSLKEQIHSIDENYLIEIANRGIVNRALRELEELSDGDITVTLEENELNAVFADNIKVRIKGSINGFDCSCPSRTICKHVLMAVISARSSICESAPCDGKVYEELIPVKEPVKTEKKQVYDESIISVVAEFVQDIFKAGLFRLPPDYSVKCSQFATLCHGAGFVVFERLFDICAKELELYEKKSSAFNKSRLIKSLAEIHRLCKSKNLSEVAGIFKQKYEDAPYLKLYGLGSYKWYAKSGFWGVTALYYCPKLKKTLTFTNSRAIEYVKNINKEMKSLLSSQPWDTFLRFDAVSKAEISLSRAKVSPTYRLSSSEKTACVVNQMVVNLDCAELSEIITEDFSKIKGLFNAESEEIKPVYAVLKNVKFDEDRYDEINQIYYADMVDLNEKRLTLSIKYSEFNKEGINNLENMIKEPTFHFDAITVIISISEENYRIEVFPIAIWVEGKIKNIHNESFYKESKESNRFSKFFKTEE